MKNDFDWSTPEGFMKALEQLEQMQIKQDAREVKLNLLEARLMGIQESLIALLSGTISTTSLK